MPVFAGSRSPVHDHLQALAKPNSERVSMRSSPHDVSKWDSAKSNVKVRQLGVFPGNGKVTPLDDMNARKSTGTSEREAKGEAEEKGEEKKPKKTEANLRLRTYIVIDGFEMNRSETMARDEIVF